MALTLAAKLLAASFAARAAAAGLRHMANNSESESNNTVVLSQDQMNAAWAFANSQGISIREAVLRLYNLNLID
jgi:hypothetical protein